MTRTLLQAVPDRALRVYIAMTLLRARAKLPSPYDVFPASHSEVMVMTRMTGHHVVTARAALEQLGLIERVQRGCYRLLPVRWLASPAKPWPITGAHFDDEFEENLPEDAAPLSEAPVNTRGSGKPGKIPPPPAQENLYRSASHDKFPEGSRTGISPALGNLPSNEPRISNRGRVKDKFPEGSRTGISPALGNLPVEISFQNRPPRKPNSSEKPTNSRANRQDKFPEAAGTENPLDSGNLIHSYRAEGLKALRGFSSLGLDPVHTKQDAVLETLPPKANRPLKLHEPLVLQRHEVLSLLDRGRRRLGIKCTAQSDYGKRCLRVLQRRLKECYTPEQLLQVCDYARAVWEHGQRFSGLKNLLYLWGTSFPAQLAAAVEGGDTPSHLVHRTGDDMTQWHDDVAEMVRRQKATQ